MQYLVTALLETKEMLNVGWMSPALPVFRCKNAAVTDCLQRYITLPQLANILFWSIYQGQYNVCLPQAWRQKWCANDLICSSFFSFFFNFLVQNTATLSVVLCFSLSEWIQPGAGAAAGWAAPAAVMNMSRTDINIRNRNIWCDVFVIVLVLVL